MPVRGDSNKSLQKNQNCIMAILVFVFFFSYEVIKNALNCCYHTLLLLTALSQADVTDFLKMGAGGRVGWVNADPFSNRAYCTGKQIGCPEVFPVKNGRTL